MAFRNSALILLLTFGSIGSWANNAQAQLSREFATTFDAGIFEFEYGLSVTANAIGEIFVTGTTEFGYDIDVFVGKFSAKGEPVWQNRYDGTAGGYDGGWSIELDPQGNVLILGDSEGAGTSMDIVVLKYSPQGDLLWDYRYDGPASGFDATQYTPSLKIDAQGDILVCGESYGGSGTGYDSVVFKIDSGGSLVWEHRYNSSGSSVDSSYGLDIDSQGNICVGGEVHDGLGAHLMTMKIRPDGTLLWESRYKIPGSTGFIPYGMTMDSQGRPTVFGAVLMPTTGYDFAAAKWDSDGNFLWAQHVDGGYGYDYPFYGASDDQGRVAITGASEGSLDAEALTLMIDIDGSLMWSHRHRGSDLWWGGASIGSMVEFDRQGHLVAVGTSFGGPPTSHDGHVLVYDPSGQVLHVDRFDGPVHGWDSFYALARLDNGKLVVVGSTMTESGTQDVSLVKYKAIEKTNRGMGQLR